MTAAQKIETKVSALSVPMLQDMARKLFVDMRAEADIVLSAVLNALEAKMPEAEFVAFCETVE